MTAAIRRLRPPRPPMWARGPWLIQLSILIVIAMATAVELTRIGAGGTTTGTAWGGLLGIVVTVGGVAVGWRWPWAGLALLATGPLVAALLGWVPIVEWSVACFAAFLLTLRGLRGLPTAVVLGLTNITAAGVAAGTIDVHLNPGASVAAFAAVAAAATGSAVRERRRYWFDLEQRTRDAVATREAAVSRGVAEERLRIARDLHDSVGHQIAVVSMHLGAAEVHLPDGATASRSDLDAARAGVQAVLQETQQILRVLRGPHPDPTAPPPDHRTIAALVDTYRSAGLTVDATLPDPMPELRPDVSAAAFRITQEALTNAHRHGTGTVSLAMDVTATGDVVIEVVNRRRPDGRPAPDDGNGIIGMRERAASTDGRFEVEADRGTFRVRAELPGESR